MRSSRAGVASIAFALVIGLLPAAAKANDDLHLLPVPRRLVDTQPGSGFQGAGQPLTGLTDPECFQIAGEVGIPDDATTLMANLTAVGFTEDGWVTVFPGGTAIPNTSNL